MGNYPLENLGPHRFQQLCQSLLSKSYPDAQCFPISQPDGGRDATLISEEKNGTETIVFQIKYTENAFKERQPHKDVLNALRTELANNKRRINSEATKYVFLTNVAGIGRPRTGSIDVAQELLNENLEVPAQCWWRDEIERRLDDAWDIKWSFPEVLRNQDILRIIIERGLTEDAERRISALRAFLREQYEYDTDVRFKQIDLQHKLLDLFIDVPVNLREFNNPIRRPRDHRAVFELSQKYASVANDRETQIGAATLLLDPIAQEHLPRVVIEGAPGQGKSTIVQYVCQVHRERLLKQENLDRRIAKNHQNCPVRLPFKVDCRDFAVWLNGKNPFSTVDVSKTSENRIRSLESFLSAQIECHSGGVRFDVSDVHAVMKTSAVLVVFDGLDEVADIRERRIVIEEITKGVRRIEELCVTLQTVVTSRPTTFANSPGLPHSKFLYLHLGSIDRATILSYAEKWVRARQLKEPDAREVQTTLEARLDHPHLRDLARNPMQLTILLSLIHRKGASLPDKRTALYDSYIDLFFDREAEKSEVVREHRDLLIDIHRYLAWILHSEAQTKQTAGRIDSSRLRKIVEQFLRVGRHDVELVDRLFSGVVERVVALVSRIEGSYEFEVQPMREYFAARYLYDTAPYSPAGNVQSGTLPQRFEALARDFFWQNVTRFYAGCYSQGQLPSLLTSLDDLAKSDDCKDSCYPQSLAITLLSDYTFAQYPNIARKVVEFILNSVDFRLIVASELYSRRGGSLYLPTGSGNKELVIRAIEELRTSTDLEYSELLVEIIRMNSELRERKSVWWDALRSVEKGADLTRWISHGISLRVFQDEDLQRLDSLLDSDECEYKERVLNLAMGEMWSYILRDERNVHAVVDAVLDRNNGLEFYRKGGLIHKFAAALSHYRYSIALREPSAHPLASNWVHQGFSEVKQYEDLPCEGDHDILKECHGFVQKSWKLSSENSSRVWATELAPWEELVEFGRRLFGDRWAFCVLASSAAGIRSKHEQCKEAGYLFAEDVSIVRRSRHARLRAGQWSWWSKPLDEASEQIEIAFLLLLLFRWAGRSVLLRLREKIEDRIHDLNEAWWGKLNGALANQFDFDYRRRVVCTDGGEFGNVVSERMVVALSPRATDRAKRNLYDRHLSQYAGSDAVILQHCQQIAFGATIGNEVDEWEKWLPSISDRHKRGIRSFYPAEPWAFAHRRRLLPLKVAEKIVNGSEEYPIVLINWAKQTCSANMAKKVVPVGTVAEKRNWFTDNSGHQPG